MKMLNIPLFGKRSDCLKTKGVGILFEQSILRLMCLFGILLDLDVGVHI